MPNKTALPQRYLLVAQLERLLRRVRKAISGINTNYNIADSETEMKKILSNLEDATTYLVDHPTEHATAEDLINRFTNIQDEHDDIMDEFRQMLQENTDETTPQQQNTNATTVQAPHTADSVQQQPILDRGTWFNQMHKKWYELDGFLMKPMQRHRLVKKMMVMQDMTLSDHKPVSITISRGKREKRHRVKDARRRSTRRN